MEPEFTSRSSPGHAPTPPDAVARDVETIAIGAQDGLESDGDEGRRREDEKVGRVRVGAEYGREPLSWKDKLGVFAIVTFSIGPVLMLGSLGVLAFLWGGNADNETWRSAMTRNWLTKAVAICSELLKQVVTFQLALGAAMLASLALERVGVLLPHLASFTMMRSTAGNGTVFVILWQQILGFARVGFRLTSVFVLALLLAIIYGLAQVISILLLSDVGLRTIPGGVAAANVSYGLSLIAGSVQSPILAKIGVLSSQSNWLATPNAYPTFAEYSEPPFVADGVSDTGLTLRAFLPFAVAQERETIRSYSGPAAVLDARVTCQVPHFTGENMQLPEDLRDLILLRGAVGASRTTPRLGNSTTDSDRPVQFSCLAPSDNYDLNEWRLAICQLGEEDGRTARAMAGGLVSEFKDITTWPPKTIATGLLDSKTYGTAYLLLNVTAGSAEKWAAVGRTGRGGLTTGYAPPAFSVRGEWMDLVYSGSDLVLSATLCYSAFDTEYMSISASSPGNRTEPRPTFDFAANEYLFPGVRATLGQYASLSPEDRGTLRLARPSSWVAPPQERPPGGFREPFMRYLADLGFPSFTDGNDADVSGIMRSVFNCPATPVTSVRCVQPGSMHIALFQEVLRTGGSAAFAMQSAITLLSSMAYYAQIGHMDLRGPSEASFFVVANVPISWVGFAVVAATVAAHLILMGIILWAFLRGTKLSRIDATWNTLAQGMKGEGRDYLEAAALMSDAEVEEKMRREGTRDVAVRVGVVGEEVGIVRLRGNADG